MFTPSRNSVMELNEVYFWTATINGWKKLLLNDTFKNIIIDSLNFLSKNNKIAVYGFVIMPNHIHVIWEMIDMNGKEKPYASFLKYTSHHFQKILRSDNSKGYYELFDVDESTRKQRYWERDPLAVKIYGKKMLEQKLEYCHNNPLQENWNLAKELEQYYYSSAYDYSNNFNTKRFSFIKHYFDRV